MSNSKVTLTFLGVGSAFSKRNYQNNLLVESDAENLLIDCGSTASRSLFEMKKSILDIDNIFVTHLHADHVGGLEEAAFMAYFVKRPGCRKAYHDLMAKRTPDGKLPPEDAAKLNTLSRRKDLDWKPTVISTINIIKDLWEHCLRGGLDSIQYQYSLLQDYFDIQALVHNDRVHASFNKCGLRFELVKVDHIYIERKFDYPCYGLIMEKPDTGKKILYTSDTKFDWSTFEWLYKHADTILHDCQLFDQDLAVHPTYNGLCKLPPEVKAKTWLMHYGDNFDKFDPAKDGFKGFIPQQKPLDFDKL